MVSNLKESKITFQKTKIALLLSMVFLLQSCYIYRDVAMQDVKVDGKTYKVVEGFEKRKVKIIAVKDTSLVVENWEGQREIQKTAIDKIKIKKFSTLLTLGVTAASAVLALAIVIAVALSQIDYNF